MKTTIYAIVTAALIAACIVLSPSLMQEVAAGAPAINGKSDRADARPIGTACSQQAWPYYEAACLRDTSNRLVQPRDVRVIGLDRLPASAGATAVASR
jgi:hypothetical protein